VTPHGIGKSFPQHTPRQTVTGNFRLLAPASNRDVRRHADGPNATLAFKLLHRFRHRTDDIRYEILYAPGPSWKTPASDFSHRGNRLESERELLPDRRIQCGWLCFTAMPASAFFFTMYSMIFV